MKEGGFENSRKLNRGTASYWFSTMRRFTDFHHFYICVWLCCARFRVIATSTTYIIFLSSVDFVVWLELPSFVVLYCIFGRSALIRCLSRCAFFQPSIGAMSSSYDSRVYQFVFCIKVQMDLTEVDDILRYIYILGSSPCQILMKSERHHLCTRNCYFLQTTGTLWFCNWRRCMSKGATCCPHKG